jgi:putative flavoprotein involved in K+ transport
MNIGQWLSKFVDACRSNNAQAVVALFSVDALWRDYLAFDNTLQTVEKAEHIADFCQRRSVETGFTDLLLQADESATEGAFTFATRNGNGRGYVRLNNGVCTTLFTSLLDLSGVTTAANHPSDSSDPFVLIVGGGQSGLALGAQLSQVNVPYLIIDKHPAVGDQWRSRYDSLVLHDPVWYDHLPLIPFPDSWPVFTPKDQMGDWLEDYAKTLGLNIATDTALTGASYDETSGRWTARLLSGGRESEVAASHLIMATGLSGFARTPEFEGQDKFAGRQFHSSEFKAVADMQGTNVVVVGANNSAHDIAADLVRVGAKPVMLQRSSTLVVKQSVYCNKMLGKFYSKEAIAKGITAEEADFLFTSIPMRLLEQRHRELWKEIQHEEREFYQQLSEAGFNLDFAEDGTGLGLKYRRTASGYYIDVGASDMVMDGRIKLRSGVNIEKLGKNTVELSNGESLPADTIVYATGYGNMVDWVSVLINHETATRVGPCWGYGSGTKGDPGPWQGELKNMWKPTAQPGLWFMGGNLAQARYFSRILALQLQARYIGVV